MTKKRVAVLMGGKSPEYEVSISSGREVVRSLDKKKYEIYPVIISRDGETWTEVSPKVLLGLGDPFELNGTNNEYYKGDEKELLVKDSLKSIVDIVFIAMHGPFGEDGEIQSILEDLEVLFTGCDSIVSALCIDKDLSKKVVKANTSVAVPNGINVAQDTAFSKIINKINTSRIGYPMVVKPNKQGSSVGMSIVRDLEYLEGALTMAFKYSDEVIIEEYIAGDEFTCAVLGNEDPVALPIIQIIPENEYFDYHSKYQSKKTQEIVPAPISEDLRNIINKSAIDVYEALGCSGFSRIDFIVDRKGNPWMLEINTIPGLTPASLLPKAAKSAGITMTDLLDKIIDYAYE